MSRAWFRYTADLRVVSKCRWTATSYRILYITLYKIFEVLKWDPYLVELFMATYAFHPESLLSIAFSTLSVYPGFIRLYWFLTQLKVYNLFLKGERCVSRDAHFSNFRYTTYMKPNAMFDWNLAVINVSFDARRLSCIVLGINQVLTYPATSPIGISMKRVVPFPWHAETTHTL